MGLLALPRARQASINSTASSRVVPGRRTTSGSGGGREHLAAVDPNDDERMLPVRADQGPSRDHRRRRPRPRRVEAPHSTDAETSSVTCTGP